MYLIEVKELKFDKLLGSMEISGQFFTVLNCPFDSLTAAAPMAAGSACISSVTLL